MDYDKLSKDILDLDSKIRFVCVCDGETRYDGHREGVNLLSPDESKKSNLEAMVIRLLLEGVVRPHPIGMGRYTMAEYEKIKQITIPLGIDHVIVTANHMELKHLEN